ncbi:MAG: hypothetical protein ACN4GR_14645 [Arenicellales bacterium]
MEWLTPTFLRMLLLVVLAILIIALYVYRRVRPYRLIRKTLSSSANSGTQIPIGYFSQEDLAGGHLHRRYAKPAMLVINKDSDIDIFVLTSWNAYIHYQIPLVDASFVWFRSMLGGLLPPLLQLRIDGRSHYLFKRNIVSGSPARTARKFYHELTAQISNLPLPHADNFRHMEWAIRIYALMLMIGVVIAIVASWAPRVDEEPMVLVQQGDGHVYAASNRWMYSFDANDRLVEKIDMQSLGFSNGVSDMEYMEDGRFLVGDSGGGIIKVCDFSARNCEPLKGFKKSKLFLRSFQFTRNPKTERIYVADSSRHRLLELDAQGELIRVIVGPDIVCFPNDPLLVDDILVIANTNHHKLLAWNLKQPNFIEPTQEWLTVKKGRDDVLCPSIIETPNTEYFAREKRQQGGSRAAAFNNARPGKVWPFVLSRGPKGGMWVLNAGSNMQYADLLMFNEWPSDSRPKRVYLDENIDPISILVRKNDVLLAESDRPSIIRISHDGKFIGNFGDTKFNNLMMSISSQQKLYALTAMYAVYAVVVLLILLLIALPVTAALRIKYIQKQDPSFLLMPDE